MTNDYRRTSSVSAVLENLKWDTLQSRRDQARLTMMYRIMPQVVDIPVEPCLTPSSQTGRTRGHDTRFQQIHTRFAGYQNSFCERALGLHILLFLLIGISKFRLTISKFRHNKSEFRLNNSKFRFNNSKFRLNLLKF